LQALERVRFEAGPTLACSVLGCWTAKGIHHMSIAQSWHAVFAHNPTDTFEEPDEGIVIHSFKQFHKGGNTIVVIIYATEVQRQTSVLLISNMVRH